MNTTRRAFDVVVLGGGPAGAGAAAALARLGVRVALVARPAEDSCEGVSRRSAALLRAQGLHRASEVLGVPLPRRAFWAGAWTRTGVEHIVSRRALHAALAADAARAGATVFDAAAAVPGRRGRNWLVRAGVRDIEGRFLVEARGRRIAHARVRGPRLLAMNMACERLIGADPGSSVVALADGWCWAVALPDGRGALQFVGAPRASGADPARRLVAAIRDCEALRPWLGGLDPAQAPVARAATAQLATDGDCVDRFAAGDALVALDPLSGQGVYEALSAVPVSVAAVTGALAGDEPALRARFVADRARAIWVRTVSAARDFYGAQAAHAGEKFWVRAAADYDALAGECASPAVTGPCIERRPVLNGTRIEQAPVVVTAEHPRGAWQVDGVGLAALIHAVELDPAADTAALARRMDRPEESVGRALGWLRRQGIGVMNVEGRPVAQAAAAGSGGGRS